MTNKLPYDETIQCVQCGYCLPACPTYLTLGKETHSPRGRINLVKMAAEGQLSLEQLKDPIDLCLGCRACETACPSGVAYGKIVEETREVLYAHKRQESSTGRNWAQDILFRNVLPHAWKLHRLADLLWLYQASGLQHVVHKTKLLNVLPENVVAFEPILPRVPSPLERTKRPRLYNPQERGIARKWKVAFFTGCVMDALFERINRLSLELLQLAGCEVHVIEGQTCCGALHAHAGRTAETIRLAKQNIEVFERLDVDFIVNNAGGCGAMLVEYDLLLAGEDEWTERAARFTRKTRDISVVLSQCELRLTHPVQEIVTYQRSCHLTNVQKVSEEPLSLLRKIPGITLREMKNPHGCCGSAGIYNVIHYDVSMEILEEKMETMKETRATTIVTTNPGCLLQMKLGVQREGLAGSVRTLHLVELLAEAAGIS